MRFSFYLRLCINVLFGRYYYIFSLVDVHLYFFRVIPHLNLLLSLTVKCCVCVKRITLGSCLYFSASRVEDFRIVNRYSWFWKSLNMADRGCGFSFCWGFHKIYDHQIRQADTPRAVDSNETNQAGADGVIMSRSRDKLKTLYSTTRKPISTKLGNLPWWTPAHKVTLPFDHVAVESHLTN